jgi:hypothetical protein
MAEQYIQKPGGESTTLAKEGFKTLQDAANVGYAPIAAPTFEPPKIENKTKINEPSGGMEFLGNKPAEPEVISKADLGEKIKETLKAPQIGTKIANKEFINAAFRYKLGRDATEEELAPIGTGQYSIGGATVKDVVGRLGISDLAPAFGQAMDDATGGDISDSTGKTDKTTDITDKTSETQKSGVISAIDDLIASKTAQMGEGVDTQAYFQKKQEAATELEKSRQAIADKQLLDAEQLETIADKPIPLNFIQRQQSQYTADQYIDNLKAVQNHNNLLILARMAEGNFLEAQRINKDIANDNYQIELLKIDRAREQRLINENEAELLRQEEQTEFDRASAGYIHIKDPALLEGLTEDQIIRVGNKVYRKPEEDPDLPSISEQLQATEAGYSIVDGKIIPITDVDKGIVGGFDIGVYATDPNHERAIAQHLANIGTLENSEDIDEYVQRVAPGSPITSDMIRSTSEKYGVPWEMLVAMMQQDSSLGTKGKGARTFNPGNVGNDDAGNIVNFGDWQSGVDAVGAWLNNHRASVEITPELELQAKNLAVKVFGKRAGDKAENINLIKDSLKKGKTIDQIEDELRYSSESTLFTGAIRDAAESIGSVLPEAKRENLFNTIDRSLEEDNLDRVRDILVKSAIDSFGTDEAKQVRGTQRTVEFLDEIADDLEKYEKLGGKTGFLEGKVEDLVSKVGKTKDPELRKLGTKIATAIQKYRRAMSGVAFSVPEAREYAKIFPSIDKSNNFNKANIEALREVMKGDFEFAMSNRMGGDAYDDLFGEIQPEDGLSDDEAYEEYLKIIK